MRSRTGLAASGVALLLVALGLVATPANAAVLPAAAGSSSVTPTGTLACGDPIGSSTPASRVQTFNRQIALPTSRTQRRALQTAELTDPATPGYGYFAKAPLYLHSGAGAAEIAVPRSERGRVAVSWGNTDHDGVADRVFHAGPCAGASTWIVFPGGYYVDEPHCVRLVVRVADDEHRIRVGVGAPCPGQRPAPEPSDG